MLKFNVELADKVLAAIKKNLNEWAQGFWAAKTDCGTSFCFAGWTVRIADGEDAFDWGLGQESTDRLLDGYNLVDGNVVPHRAAELLGFEWAGMGSQGAGRLFSTSNSLNDLERIIDDLAGRREECPDVVRQYEEDNA